jgi:hypothetical protein
VERRTEEVLLRRRLAVLVAAALVLVMLVALSAPAFAQGGCKEFGTEGVADTAHARAMGGLASTHGPNGDMDEVIHDNQDLFCES